EASKNSEQKQDDQQLNASGEEVTPPASDEGQKLLEDKSVDEVVDEIEQHVATESEDEKEPETTETEEHIPVLSYKDMDLAALLAEAKQLLEKYPVNKIKTHLEEIKAAFDDKVRELTEKFKAEHPDVEDFELKIPEIREFKLLWKEYKSKWQAYRKAIQDKLEANLKKRQDLIEALKGTIDSTEYSFEERLKKFKEIQKQWRTAGSMPRNKYNDIWQTFKHHEERFYDLLDLDRDYRDKVFQENLEQKKAIIEHAKGLLNQDDIHHIFKELQALHKKWKEETGPVAKEYREKVWEEFKEVTKQIHDKRRDFYKKLKDQFAENLEKKQTLILKLKEVTSEIPQNHKDWQNKIKEVEKIREAFYQIGYVPKQNREEIWNEFKSTIKAFNKEKNHFYKSLKELQKENLEKKLGLIKIAEELKDSEEWETATQKFKEIQEEWKKIGHVPRKVSEKIWQQFRTACNHYFDRYYQHVRSEKNEEFDSFNKKKDYLNQLKEQFKEIDDKVNYTIDDIQAIIAKWKELGYVPDSKRYINAKFNKFINSLYDKLNIDKRELSFLKFKNTVDQYFEEGNYRKLDAEKRFVRQKVDSILKEIEQSENNMMFIKSNDKNNPFKKEAEKNVAKNLEILAFWKRKQQYLDSLNY
ncbi:MAG TPA: DUF349 domain-containing protein, partial [Flavobacteriia bacterium]|nr:DUF349 domain-containing protein [Flavobacteriia bacterium]